MKARIQIKWKNIRLKSDTINSLKVLKGELDVVTYDDVIKFMASQLKH